MTAPQLICKALAGTGKTTTGVEGIKRQRGGGDWTLKPSTQQQRIWEVMNMGAKPDNIGFAAFNNTIKDEMAERLLNVPGCSVSTMHSLGFSAIKTAIGRRVKLDKWKVKNILQEVYNVDYKMMMKQKGAEVTAICRLAQLAKYSAQTEPNNSFLTDQAAYYGVEVNGSEEEIFNGVRAVMAIGKDDLNHVDFDDMIWLPIVNNLPIEKFDLLVVDEGQDLNQCQQKLALRASDRVMLIGDENQAIYGFAGADTKGMGRMFEQLNSRPSGCLTEPLTITYRCSHAVVGEAQKIVPEYEAFHTNKDGLVSTIDSQEYTKLVQPGDMVLCRVNAPLVRNAFQLLSEGKKAEVVGRDLSSNLTTLIKNLKPMDVDDLQVKLYNYQDREIARIKKNPRHSETAVLAVEDKCECLRIFCMKSSSIEDLFDNLADIFSVKHNSIRLSSIHRAKGLESDTVFILHPELLPHPMAKSDWEKEQEKNLKYVAITRAKDSLYWVKTPDKENE